MYFEFRPSHTGLHRVCAADCGSVGSTVETRSGGTRHRPHPDELAPASRRSEREKLKDAVCSEGAAGEAGVHAASSLLTSMHLAEPADVAAGFCRFWKVTNLRCVDPHCPRRPSERSLSPCSLFFFSLPLTDCVNSPCDRKRLYAVSGQWLPTIARGTLLHVHNQCKPDFARAHQPF